MCDFTTISDILNMNSLEEAIQEQQKDEEKTKMVMGLIQTLGIKDFQFLRNEIDALNYSVSLTYGIEDVEFFLEKKDVTLSLDQKMEILNDFVENVSSYGDDWNALFPLCVQEYLDKLDFEARANKELT